MSRYIVQIQGEKREVTIELRGQRWAITIDGEMHLVEQSVIEKDEHYSLLIEGQSFLVDLIEKNWQDGEFTVNAIAEQINVRVRDELEAVADEITRANVDEGLFVLKAPMPGIVVRALALPGETVEKGQGLLVLEAMKMQNELVTEIGGIVQEIEVKDGEMVEAGATLVRVIADDSTAGAA
ncbi:MAG: acetyl-CoA carboxylase biotin carboxyl carrier protein subunit [bacterium]|nr:acetyl-CoA carboxylase biotin carboxyl carrier protein subunit [bacterium]